MIYGYSTRLVTLNKEASGHLIGVKLGRECMGRNLPVTQVARELKVSRQTIYNWFCGKGCPRRDKATVVIAYIARLKKNK
jgi:DNA-binding phage protein